MDVEVNEPYQPQPYALPVTFCSSMKWYWHVLCVVVLAPFVSMLFLSFDTTSEKVLMRFLGGLSAAIFAYLWLSIGVFRQGRFTMDEQGVSLRWLYQKRRLLWEDIGQLELFPNGMLGFSTKKRMELPRNWRYTVKCLLLESYDMTVPFRFFAPMDLQKLFDTVALQLEKQDNANTQQAEIL